MNSCLKNSNLWAHVKILKLTKNMRGRFQNDDSGQTFSDQLLAIGKGKLPVVGKAKNVVYSQFLRSLKHIYKSIYIHRWDTGTQLQWRVTNMARNDLRARGGGLGGREAPLQLGVAKLPPQHDSR